MGGPGADRLDRLESEIAALRARVSRSEDERGVLDTLQRYGHSIDYGLEEAWVDCFTDDGVWDVRIAPGAASNVPTRRIVGSAALAKSVAAHSRAPDKWHKHLINSPQIAIDGDRATAETYFARHDVDIHGPFVQVFGRYLDTLVRCDDGRWRFSERIAQIESSREADGAAAPSTIERLADIEAIHQLKARYCRLLDAQEWTAWGEVFTTDAVLRFGPSEHEVVVGRDTIVSHIQRVLVDAITVHQAKMPEIEITGPDSARGTWAMFDYTDSPHGFTDRIAADSDTSDAGSTGRGAKQGWGHYLEEYRRTDDGWQMSSLTLTRLRIDRL
jgi:hypothetical protein